MDDTEVVFLWKDYRNEHKQKQQTMRLPAPEFIRRFLMHAVPPGFPSIRYRFLAGANRPNQHSGIIGVTCSSAAKNFISTVSPNSSRT